MTQRSPSRTHRGCYNQLIALGAFPILPAPIRSRGVAQPGRAPGSGPGGRRFKSSLPDQSFSVRSGDIGNRTFRRHRLHFWPEGVLQGLQGFFLQINIAEIVIHKADQPDAMVDFFDADGLAGEGHAEVDLLVVQAKTSAAGDHDRAVDCWRRVAGTSVIVRGSSKVRALPSKTDMCSNFETSADAPTVRATFLGGRKCQSSCSGRTEVLGIICFRTRVASKPVHHRHRKV